MHRLGQCSSLTQGWCELVEQQRTGIDLLRFITNGYLDKHGVSFKLLAETISGKRRILVDLKFGESPSSVDKPRFKLSYYDTENDPNYLINLYFPNGVESVSMGEKSHADKAWGKLISSHSDDFSNFIPSRNSGMDIYGLLNSLSDEIYNSEETFEFNSWHRVVNIFDYVPKLSDNGGVPKFHLLDSEYHIHGGMGTVDSMLDMHKITFSVEHATVKETYEPNMSYLLLSGNITDTDVKQGLQSNPTLDHLRDLVLHQYRNARPLTQLA